MNYIYLYNPQHDIYKKTKLGTSYTVLLSLIFGPWIVPLFRRDYRVLAIVVLLNLVSLALIRTNYNIFMIITAYLIFICLGFVYNNIYFKDLLNKGYKILDIHDPNTMNKTELNTSLEKMGLENLDHYLIQSKISLSEIEKVIKKNNNLMIIIVTIVFIIISLIQIYLSYVSIEEHKKIKDKHKIEQQSGK